MTDRPMIFSAPMVQALLSGRKTMTRRVLKPPYEGGQLQCTPCGVWKWWKSGSDLPFVTLMQRFAPGDTLWVQEVCRAEELSRPPSTRPATKLEREKLGRTMVPVLDELDGADGVRYLADGQWIKIENSVEAADRWGDLFHYAGRGKRGVGNNVSPIHMPRWASRITLTITDVRVQRLRDISEADAVAEGAAFHDGGSIGHSGWRHDLTDVFASARDSYASLWHSIHGAHSWQQNPWVCALTFSVSP